VVERSFHDLFDQLQIIDRKEAITEAFKVVSQTLKALEKVIDPDQFDPGHGLGHLARDLIHANLLAEENLKPKDLYVGIIAGALHDIGCCLVDRYADKNRAIKHAEAGALLWLKVSKELGLGRTRSLLIYYAIAGHTHLLKEMRVVCDDGQARVCSPYCDLNEDGSPRMMFWFPRMVDRLDVIGPCFLGRHFLTLDKDHSDFDGNYYSVTFTEHMRPLLREPAEIQADPNGRTLREHLALFANSQNNLSVYGRFDGPVMQKYRDKSKEQALKIVQAFTETKNLLMLGKFHVLSAWTNMLITEKINLIPVTRNYVLSTWTNWVENNIEPSDIGSMANQSLESKFSALPEQTKDCWYNVFAVCLVQYRLWRVDRMVGLTALEQPHLIFPIIGDLRDYL